MNVETAIMIPNLPYCFILFILSYCAYKNSFTYFFYTQTRLFLGLIVLLTLFTSFSQTSGTLVKLSSCKEGER